MNLKEFGVGINREVIDPSDDSGLSSISETSESGKINKYFYDLKNILLLRNKRALYFMPSLIAYFLKLFYC